MKRTTARRSDGVAAGGPAYSLLRAPEAALPKDVTTHNRATAAPRSQRRAKPWQQQRRQQQQQQQSPHPHAQSLPLGPTHAACAEPAPTCKRSAATRWVSGWGRQGRTMPGGEATSLLPGHAKHAATTRKANPRSFRSLHA
ncbi:MAG: hypothetical protein WDW38_003783 [Sanguina aurantia]